MIVGKLAWNAVQLDRNYVFKLRERLEVFSMANPLSKLSTLFPNRICTTLQARPHHSETHQNNLQRHLRKCNYLDADVSQYIPLLPIVKTEMPTKEQSGTYIIKHNKIKNIFVSQLNHFALICNIINVLVSCCYFNASPAGIDFARQILGIITELFDKSS